MKGYGQFCPIAKASEVLGERWTHLIIRELHMGSNSFNDLRKGMPLISPTLLSTRLKSLEHHGIVLRKEQQSHVSYHLSEAGHELMPVIMQMGAWGHKWVRSDLSEKDLDPSMLMWDIHRNIDTSVFKHPRTVIQFVFTNFTSKFRNFWLVISNDDVDVCLKDQGYDVDLVISTKLKTLAEIWMGDTTLMKEMRAGHLKASGNDYLRQNMINWLGTNYYADIKAAR
ncbi:HxlR family transcriptional regulator [Thalassotalea insulae]|uniref:HxlR family transcriptional regulator n=1 Tax=Thalassotalea insulae TaxID=2056778 RepID=A0ABQ6GZK8_9GAMM|nr:winged helix-turn-helix transcriptional regulator [Thalassotalea insulae]GLX79930.1 HxlR family transcriptional regulator [Thalassotalea insulae]